MKTKEIHSILGVAPATFFDWNKSDSKKKKLAKLLKELDTDAVVALLEKAKKKPKKPNMLLYTVNQSIGDKSKHFTLTSLKNLFYKKEPFNLYDKYAISTIKHEAKNIEIEQFANYYKIPMQRIDRVLKAC